MIETALTVLRPLEPRDLDSLYRFRNDDEVIRHLGGFSAGYARADLISWLEYHRGRSDEVLWAIATRDDDSCIGHVGLYQLDYRVRKGEFAILIGDEQWRGRGVGKEVTLAMLDYGFSQLNLHKISLTVLTTNERAIRLYERLGFRVDGTLRHEQFRDGMYIDTLAMSILETEWKA